MTALSSPLIAGDGTRLHAVFTPPLGKVKAAIHLAHGMGEHQGRYGHVRAALNAAGYAVLAHDHRGHGKTAALNAVPLGHMTASGATMETWVADMAVARRALIAQVGADVPLVLLGHSMGSFFAQRTVQVHPGAYQGLILSGSTGQATLKQTLASYIPRIEAAVRGRNVPAKTFHELTFQDFNRAFRADGHRQAWLSRDPEVWAAYAADPYCDFVVYSGGYVELGRMIRANTSPAGLQSLDRAMPTLMFGGTQDALSGMGPGLQRLYDQWQARALVDLELKFWQGGRHECLNETNKHEVITFLIAWLDRRFGGQQLKV